MLSQSPGGNAASAVDLGRLKEFFPADFTLFAPAARAISSEVESGSRREIATNKNEERVSDSIGSETALVRVGEDRKWALRPDMRQNKELCRDGDSKTRLLAVSDIEE